ncbi:MAG: VCBS repeat-containing protein [Halieaceae bacterium]|jgi:hypothetical protein|nr:VCBS repeat-containing protein [Halieaceae bacterium]
MHIIDGSLAGADGVDLFDVDGDGDFDAVAGWEESRALRLYQNPGRARVQGAWPATDISGGLTIGKIEDARFADLDRDGRLDAVFSAEEKGSEQIAANWLVPDSSPTQAASWEGHVLAPVPAYRYIKVAFGDLNGDGLNDVVAGAKTDGMPGALIWLRTPATSAKSTGWQAQVIDQLEWVDSLLVVDVDDDGHRDILVNHAGFLGWYRNPGEPGTSWTRHTISNHTGPYFAVCPDPQGLLSLVAGADISQHEAGGRVLYWLQRDAAADSGWTETAITSRQPVPRDQGSRDYQIKGLACGALDDNPRPDVAVTISGRGAGVFAVMNLDPAAPTGHALLPIADVTRNSWKGIKYDNVELADVDGDGDLDLVTTEENGRSPGWLGFFRPNGIGVLWFENPLR